MTCKGTPQYILELLSTLFSYLTSILNTNTMAATNSTTTATAEPITADSILRLFPDIDTSSSAMEGHDEEQIRLMDEVCIVLDENDKPIGNFSKKICRELVPMRSETN